MQDPSDTKATVRCADMDLADASVRKHVKDGMRLTHLGSRVRQCAELRASITTGGHRQAEAARPPTKPKTEAGDEDPLALLDAEIALLTGTLRELIFALGQALGAEHENEAHRAA
jgi:DNA recombination-dependent growth factor C